MSEHNIQLNPESAKKLADALTRRRVELGIRSARQLGVESGLDYRTITGIEAKRRSTVSRNTLAVLEMQLQWPSGYLMALVDTANQPRQLTIELDVPSDADANAVEKARQVAQATFNATIRQLQGF